MSEIIGDMEVITMCGTNKHREKICKVKCIVCGEEKIVPYRQLKRNVGIKHGLGCGRKSMDLITPGSLFGDMEIINSNGKSKRGSKLFKVRCTICGKERIVEGNDLRKGSGINHKTACVDRHDYKGLAKKHPRLFSIWNAINTRTTKEQHPSYKNYGAKGIRNDFSSFEEFIELMGESYYEHVEHFGESNTTLDRLDSSENYSYKNCRWATYATQAVNKSTTIVFDAISPDGKEYTSNNIKQFAKDHNIDANGIKACLHGKKDNYKGWKFKKSTNYVIFINPPISEECK